MSSARSFVTIAPELIVDFPTHQMRSTNKKSVTFSPMSHLRTFKVSEEEKRSKSYSKSDYKIFQEVRNYEIAKCSSMIALKIAAGGTLTADDMTLCRGIEPFLSPDIPKRIKKISKARQSHIDRVLAEHSRQVSSGKYKIASVARVSQKSSRSARSRSHNTALASLNWFYCLY